MNWHNFWLAVLMAVQLIGVLLVVWKVGKRRDPLTTADAVVAVTMLPLWCWLYWYLAGGFR